MSAKVYLAVDLGASSGRVLAGLFDGQRLALEEVHRFDNGPVLAADTMHWDLLDLWRHVQDGLRAAASRYGRRIVSVGVDTWGVDFGLLGRHDQLLGNPVHYRDRRTAGILPRAFERVPREEIFAATGLQFMEFNTLYQLWAMRRADSPLLEAARQFLMIPDLFHWLLTGQKGVERTNASTTQFFDPRTGQWATQLLERFEIPTQMLGPILEPGTRLGRLRESVEQQTGLSGVEVVLPGTHDTASAVLAVPSQSVPGDRPDWSYISSGTWSLMGVEVPRPVINQRCSGLNFTNEGGVGGTTRLLKNIAGLWLLQECRRIWQQQGRTYGWDELVERAATAPPLVSLINPDDPSFVAPDDMPAAIAGFCQRTGQPVPADDGAMARCVLESLALRYRVVGDWLGELVGGPSRTLHIVGGGARNGLLCQMAADACGCPVVAGPVEATELGNLLMQALSWGDVATIAEGRELIGRSFDVQTCEPVHTQLWDDAFARFENVENVV
ncbi:MAG: rhamnulokinase [Pirellulaceae bacterium]|nr:rhamnulokinase [Pirellulaceae bacterium]